MPNARRAVPAFPALPSPSSRVDELEGCAEDIVVAALDGGEYASYILGAPAFVNAAFRELYSGGIPVATPLVARSD